MCVCVFAHAQVRSRTCGMWWTCWLVRNSRPWLPPLLKCCVLLHLFSIWDAQVKTKPVQLWSDHHCSPSHSVVYLIWLINRLTILLNPKMLAKPNLPPAHLYCWDSNPRQWSRAWEPCKLNTCYKYLTWCQVKAQFSHPTANMQDFVSHFLKQRKFNTTYT